MPDIRVLSGHKRVEVGTIPAEENVLTNQGRVARVTPGGTVVVQGDDGKETRVRDASKLTVRLSEARRLGFPDQKGNRTAELPPARKNRPRRQAEAVQPA